VYAFGLNVTQYRGLPLVEHGGSSGGYRSIISRFPSEHTSIVALCNRSDANTTALSHQVADIILSSKLSAPASRALPDSTPTPVFRGPAPGARELAVFAGRYYAAELDATYDISVSGQALTVRRPRGEVDTLQFVRPQTFRSNGLTYRFETTSGGPSPSFAVDIGRARGIVFKRAAR
jgi:hypothetical protein